MKTVFTVILFLIICSEYSFSQEIRNPNNNPVIGFINKEKFRIKAEEAIDRYKHPDKYNNTKIKDKESPDLQKLEGEYLVSKRSMPESELSAAINPINDGNMVVSPISQNVSNEAARVTCPVYYTMDSGKTWKTSSFISKPNKKSNLLIGGGDPVLIFDAKGNLYFSWINVYLSNPDNNYQTMNEAIFWAKSTDGGVTFEFNEDNYFGEKIFSSGSLYISEMHDKQWMAADLSGSKYKNSVYTSMIYISEGSSGYDMKLKVYRKRENENQFSRKPAVINTEGFDIVQFGSIDADNSGNVHYTFYGIKNQYSQSLYHCLSTDGGVTFSNPVKISNLTGSMRGMPETFDIIGISESRMYPAPYMAVDKGSSVYGGNIYVTWTACGINNNDGYSADIYLSVSSDYGKTWKAPVKVNNDAKQGIPNFYSNIAVNQNGVVCISWYDRRNYTSQEEISYIGTTDFFAGISYDGGSTFENIKVSSSPSKFESIGMLNYDFGIGEYNAVMINKDYAYPVWADGRTSDGDIDIYMAKISLDKSKLPDVEAVSPVSDFLRFDNIFPVPSNDYLNVSFTLNKPAKILIEITDLNGKQLLPATQTDILVGEQTKIIDIREISIGAYFVKISAENSYCIKKFYKISENK